MLYTAIPDNPVLDTESDNSFHPKKVFPDFVGLVILYTSEYLKVFVTGDVLDS